VKKQLAATPKTAEEIAHALGADPEDVFHILHHLASNDPAVHLAEAEEVGEDRFSVQAPQRPQ
jgi:hypothetical protein